MVDAAARASGLDIAEIKSYLPGGLTLWIDPGEVSYRVGEHGHLQVSQLQYQLERASLYDGIFFRHR